MGIINMGEIGGGGKKCMGKGEEKERNKLEKEKNYKPKKKGKNK